MQERGIFAFTVEDQKPGQEDSYDINRVEVAEQPKPESAVTLYRHGESRIREILAGQGLSLLRALEFVGFRYPAENRDVMFKAYVTQKD
jgi:type II secretory pathway component PulM